MRNAIEDSVASNSEFGDLGGKSYAELHKPSSAFATRNEYLEHELQVMQPKKWRPNLPFKDYRFEIEDTIPAMAGTIGKIVMVGAMAGAFAIPLGLDQAFILQNVRYEMIIAAIFIFIFSGFLLPSANLPGTHGPLVALIPLVVAVGGHPLAFGILIGVFGLLMAVFKGGTMMARLTSNGVAGGLLLYLGFVGTIAQVKNMIAWADKEGLPHIAFIIIMATIVMYALLEHWQKRWLAVPVGCALAGVLAFVLGAPFEFKTGPGLPPLNPAWWWGAETGWGIGLPDMKAFVAVFPFAVLAVAMWSPDFLGHKVFQQISYPPRSGRTHMNIDDTMVSCSVRQVIGSALGGANFTSSWGTYIVPAAIAKRPIPAGAILTGVFCIVAAVWGYPMDLAIWQPVLSTALIVAVFVPLLEAGMEMTREGKTTQSAAIVVFASALVNPVFGWSFTMLLDNLGLIGDKQRSKELGLSGRVVIPAIGFLVLCLSMGAVGMFPGIPALLPQFR
ncbi:MAG: DUF3360 family protein [Moraxella sp.]|nr:DUF3360 family protein [Moraxella sp.]